MRRNSDLLVAMALIILQVLLVVSNINGPVRITSGLLFTGFFPGYCLLSAAYKPFRSAYGVLTQVSLAVAVSLAVVAAGGMLVNLVDWAVSPVDQATWIGAFSSGMAIAAIVRERFIPWGDHSSRSQRLLTMAGVVALVFLAGLGMWALASGPQTSRDNPETVSLYMLTPNGRAADYPIDAAIGESVNVTVGVQQVGGNRHQYRLVGPDGESTSVQLTGGTIWESPVSAPVPSAGENCLAWRLYVQGSSNPVREVDVWVRGR